MIVVIKKIKIKTIKDCIIYAKNSKNYLLELYYLVSYKNYFKKKYLKTFDSNYAFLKYDK